jgi:hypothetical protein
MLVCDGDYQQVRDRNSTFLKLNNFSDNLEPRLGLIWDLGAHTLCCEMLCGKSGPRAEARPALSLKVH